MERPLWSGTLAFGIVTIPIRMMAAVRDHDVHFHQISRTDRKRIRYKKVAEGSDEEVDPADIVRGYAVKEGHYVVFDDEELARLGARKSRVIDLTSFVALADIDPLYFDRPYRLEPDKRGEKPYRLLVETMARSQRVGVAQMVMHGKEHILAVRSINGDLIAHTLRFADEVMAHGAPNKEVKGAKAKAPNSVKLVEREVAMAERVVESMHGHFDPADYTDEYRRRLQDAITRKARGRTLVIEEADPEPASGNVIDLMAALEGSLNKHDKRAAKTPASKGPALKSVRRPSVRRAG